MEKPLVLLIHGMGTHQPGAITDEFQKGLAESAKFLGIEDFNASDEFEFDEFNYSEFLDDWRNQHANHAQAITDAMLAGPSFLNRILSFQAKLANDEFLYTHWLDVFVYCVLDTVRVEVTAQLMAKLMTILKAAKDDNDNPREVIFVAHSLGTALLHDTLDLLYVGSGGEPDTTHTIRYVNYPIDGLWMVANVSRLTHILTRLRDPEHSIVRDNSVSHDGICTGFYPVFNEFDPFTLIKRYKVEPVFGELIRTKDFRRLSDGWVNPHDFGEYMSDPSVGGVFLDTHSSHDISLQQLRDAMASYRHTTLSGNASSKYKAIKKAIADIEHAIDQGASKTQKVILLMELYEHFKEAYDLLKSGFAKR
ncbi:hypothetical protein DXX93_07805 [Thalassotalea euphylliae]|uniref:Alpha/beta hydrolase n=1 Tax=Thalassotalea euphylliae TaxID=1655234 RepID=A0A3E0TQ86_9GAMM|nr:hypothetical protein [Thalassotalea euphylliae]REL26497.1 hypothetical protein DXX93_07805 [Thalassotalea euphylliae]